MKRLRLETQVIIIMVCALGVFLAWFGIELTRDRLDLLSQKSELAFEAENLGGLRIRSGVYCRGAQIGRVRKIEAHAGRRFEIIAGIRRDFADWAFEPTGTIESTFVESPVSPASIHLEVAGGSGVTPTRGTGGWFAAAPSLERLITLRIPEEKRSAMERLTENLPKTVESLQEIAIHVERLLTLKPEDLRQPDADRTAIERVGANLLISSESLRKSAETLEKQTGDERLTLAFNELFKSIDDLKKSTARADAVLEKSEATMDTIRSATERLLKQSDETLAALRVAADKLAEASDKTSDLTLRFGDTFLGRLFVAKRTEESPPPAVSAADVERQQDARSRFRSLRPNK